MRDGASAAMNCYAVMVAVRYIGLHPTDATAVCVSFDLQHRFALQHATALTVHRVFRLHLSRWFAFTSRRPRLVPSTSPFTNVTSLPLHSLSRIDVCEREK